jgi:very-short-patch-repair endonuclease
MHPPEVMRRKDPTNSPEARARISETMKARGHQPKVRGGNGRPPTEAEVMLVKMLCALGFKEQCIVRTGMGRYNEARLPTHYKIDCGNPDLKIAIEADGKSHRMTGRPEQDAKKDKYLAGQGWTVLRFSNEKILNEWDSIFPQIMSTILKSMNYTPI